MKKIEDKQTLNIKPLFEDVKFELVNYIDLELFAYLNPDNVKQLEVRIENSPVVSRNISVNKEVPYMKFYPGETILIPVGFGIVVPYGYSLYLEVANDLHVLDRLDARYSQLLFIDNQAYISVVNNTDGVKQLAHGTNIATGKLIKNELFDLDVEEITNG